MSPYYEQDGIVIFHGHCLEIMAVVHPTCDHFITDPPYARDVYLRMSAPSTHTGSGTHGRMSIPAKGKQGRAIHDIKDGSLARMAAGDIGHIDELIQPVAIQLGALTKRWGIVFSDAESCHLWRLALSGELLGGMRYVRTGAWVKPDAMPQMSGDRPAVGFEPCTIVSNEKPMRWNGGGHPAIWTFGTCKVDRPDHPCPKPLPLMAAIITQFTDPGETILDPFMGSGTTLVAAKRLGRKAIGIEIEEKYCEIAAERLAQGALDLFSPDDDYSGPEPDINNELAPQYISARKDLR